MGDRYEGKVALITGAGSGIGRAVTLRLLDEGASVLAVDVDEAGLEDAAGFGALAEGDGELATLVADLSEPDACVTAVHTALGRFGRLDVLGNVAGILVASHATDLTREQYRKVMAINLDAPFFLSQAAIPHLLQSEGNIVNVASNAGLQGVPYVVAYCMSKGGVVQMTRALATEYLKTPLRVNAIAPAGTRTNIAATASFPPDIDVALASRMGGHRGLTEPEEVAALFAYLASDEARSVTGAVYAIDNGLTAS